MSLFIDAENQELLWKLFHTLPNIDRIDYESKANIFKGAIETVYYQISPNISSLSKSDLQEINKQAMTILIQNVRSKTSSQETTTIETVNTYKPSMSSQNTNVQMYETPQEKTQRIFEEKQQQYQTMNAKPDLPKPSELFEEKTSDDNDGVITNMDELLAQYEMQRQQDVPIIVESKYDVSDNDVRLQQESLNISPKGMSSPESLEELHEKIRQLTSRIEILELSSQESKEKFENLEMKKQDEDAIVDEKYNRLVTQYNKLLLKLNEEISRGETLMKRLDEKMKGEII